MPANSIRRISRSASSPDRAKTTSSARSSSRPFMAIRLLRSSSTTRIRAGSAPARPVLWPGTAIFAFSANGVIAPAGSEADPLPDLGAAARIEFERQAAAQQPDPDHRKQQVYVAGFGDVIRSARPDAFLPVGPQERGGGQGGG